MPTEGSYGGGVSYERGTPVVQVEGLVGDVDRSRGEADAAVTTPIFFQILLRNSDRF